MAKFDPPWSTDGDRRLPLPDEQQFGFQCGPADRRLFSGLLFRVESELKAIQDAGGIPGSDTEHTTVLQAILELISSATGGGDPENYVQFPQATARLPFFPELLTADGKLGATSPGVGQVRVPGAKTILHRGISLVNTVEEDLPTDANKIYHLRWVAGTGWDLSDLADLGYNPLALEEGNTVFDSSYDNMLAALVTTNGSNVPTITNLVNKHQLNLQTVITGTNIRNAGLNAATHDIENSYNWSRRPSSFSLSIAAAGMSNAVVAPSDITIGAKTVGVPTVTAFDVNRYRISQSVMYDYSNGIAMQFTARS